MMISYSQSNIVCLFLGFFLISIGNTQNSIAEIPLPSKDFIRIPCEENSFAKWLRNLELKDSGAPVYDFKGRVFKTGEDTIVAAVVKWDIYGKRLEQCMDIIVRMYAEFLWEEKLCNGLGFPLPGGTWLYWGKWKEGYRPYFTGVRVNIIQSATQDTSYASYNQYLNTIFAESHTQQFYHSY